MFSDRLWILKVAAAAGLLGWLCTVAGTGFAERQPGIRQAALFSEQFRDRIMFVDARIVLAVDPTGIRIATDAGPMHVRTTERPAVGEIVSGVVRCVGHRQLEAIKLEVNEGFRWKRPINYIASTITLIVYLWFIRRRFRWNPEAGLFRARY